MKLSCHSPPLKTAWRTTPSRVNPHLWWTSYTYGKGASLQVKK
jgi:hypothetical protein